jgi:L-Ala-D/L-Glu epimerase
MRIVEITALVVHLPLKREIKHASAVRRESVNLLVRCRLADGSAGWGEGVPRSYVTGETPEGALAQLSLSHVSVQLSGDFFDWPQVIALCERFRPAAVSDDLRGSHGNALRCAVELSILDAFGRLFGEPVSAVTQHVPAAATIRVEQPRVRYSGAITAEGAGAEQLSALKMRLYGFAQCKVKVGVAGADDRRRMESIRRWIGRVMDLRIDANEAWPARDAAARIEALLPYGITCVEQPVSHAEVGELAAIRQKVDVPIMLDESLTSHVDAETAIRTKTCDLFNIRLSKCGGFINSLRLAAMAREAGLGYQLGCHPGESGLLSAAGRHWAASVGGIRYCEGSYDRHVLRELVTNEDLTFGYGGWAPALSTPGLGATPNPAVLSKYTLQQQTFRLE